MAEHHDYQALEWVKGEIDETLKQAQQSLEAFVDNPDDSTRMRFCLTHLHQVYGTLQMVEFYGAALVAEEMEKLAQALLNQTTPHVADAQEVLMRAILQLPVYLDGIKTARRDMPVVVLPLLNDLRAARGESLLSETALFKPDLAAGSAAAPKEKVSAEALAQLPELLKKIRQLYQFALVGLIRHQDMPTNLGYMAKSLTKLEQLYSNTAMAQLWWVSAALVDGVSRNEIELGTSVKMLFGQLDRQLKHSIDTGANRNEAVPTDLLKNLLFYVARCKGEAPRIRKVKEAFKLDSALPSEEMLDLERRRMAGPDRSAISSVVRALLDELGTVKDTLDLFMRGQNSATADLKPVIPVLKQVADTLAVLGIGNPRRVIMEQIDVVGRITSTSTMPADTVLMDVAGALLYVEATLQGMADDAGRNSSAAVASGEPGHVSPEHVVKARAAVIEESRAGLENAKDAISEYHATGFNPAALDLVPDILHSVRGGLLMIPLAYPGALLQSCIDFIREQLIEKRVKPTWRELDTLADAITSIEYYLERLGDRFPGDEDILAIAEDAVAALGYPAARVSAEEMAPTLGKPTQSRMPELSVPVVAEPFAAAAPADVDQDEDETAIAAELTLVPGADEEFITFSAEELAELEAEATPAPAPAAPMIQAAAPEPLEEEENDLIDDEVIEIFIEEAGEVLETINENLPQWAADTENEDALKELRRAYHTLKGSGRMVGAKVIGELAWSVENMLNRVLDRSIHASGSVIRIVETVTGVVPSLVKSFEARTKHTINVDALAAVADALAKGQTPPPIPADLTLAAAAPIPAAVAEEAPEEITLAAAEPAQEAAEIEAAAEEWGFALEQPAAEAEPAFELPVSEETEFELADEFASLEDREHAEPTAEMAEESGLEFDLMEPETELPILEAETAADWSDLGFVEEQVEDTAARTPEAATEEFVLADSADDFSLVEPPLVEPPLVEEITLIEEIPAAIEAESASTGIEIDPVLVDIFSQEAAAHLQTIKEFLAIAGEREPLTETLLRALHTLKGSAHMAGIKPIAELATPIERFIKECHLQGVPADERIKLLLDDVVRLIEQGLVDLKSHPSQPLHGSEIVLQCIDQMREEKLKHAREAQAAKLGRPDPALVSLFLAEGMDLIVDAGDVLRHWEENPIPGTQLDNLRQELRILARGASAAQLSEVVVLCMTLEELYNAAASGMITPDSHFFRTAHKAHEELVNMMDYIAAGQPIAPADAIVSELQALMDQAPQVSEQIEQAAQLHVEQAPAAEAELLFEAIEPAEDIELGEPVAEEVPLFQFEPEAEAQPEPVSAAAETAPSAAEEEMAFRLEEETPAHLFEEPVLEELKFEEPTFAEPTFEEPVLDSLPAFEAEEFVLDNTEDAAPLEEAEELDQLEEEISPALASAGPASDFDPELVEIFLEEAGDIMESTANQLQSWMENPDDLAVVAALQRDLHTLKGGARMSDMREIGDLSHHLENLYEGLCERRFTAVPALFDLLNQCHDRLAVMLEKVQKGLAPAPAPDLIGKIDDFVHGRLGAEPEHVAPEDHAEAQATYAIAANEAEPEEDSHALQALSGEGIDTEILEIFLEEAGELTEGIDNTINAWLADRDNPAYLEEMKRLLHTLKGGARLAGMMHIGDLSHHFESFLVQSEVDRVPQNDAYFARVQAEHDKLFVQMDHLRKHGGGLITAAEVSAVPQPEPETPELAAQAAQLEPVADQPAIPDNVVPIVAQPLPDFETPDMLPASAFHLDEPKRRNDESVKVPADLLENLVNLAGETSIIRGRIEQEMTDFSTVIGEISQTIDRARELLRRLDMETEAQVLHRYQQAATEGTEYEEFDPLEMDRYSTLNQLSRSLGETVSDMTDLRDSLVNRARDAETLLIQQGRINTELQEGLMRSRMVPFSRMVPRLRRIVRQVAQELGKKADLEIVGAEGEMDRTVLERMVPPLEHMLRNAVDHGLEMPEDRIAKGKKEQGRITIHLAREGGEVVLRLTDDGKGIALDKVKQRAIERNLMKADAPLSDKEIMQFIFKPGFSTAEKVTQISGRGVGMDVVHSEIKQLGGNVKIHSAPGAGSQFTIRLPFTVSVNRALMVRVGEDLYAIPLNNIEGIVRVSPYELEAYYSPDAPKFEYAGQSYSMRYLGRYVHNIPMPNLVGHSRPLPVLLVRGGEHAVALQVDSLVGSREIVVKSVGPQLAAVSGISGATILGDGSVVIILDLGAVIRAEQAQFSRQEAAIAAAAKLMPVLEPVNATPLVMVVDDSVTVRKVTSRLLERNGYDVLTAKDGVDAITQLQECKPDVMLLDIEMPRMDGFEVATLVRHDERLKNTPIIMITSRTGEKHRDRALSIGVNRYMGKPYQETQLLQNIEELIRQGR